MPFRFRLPLVALVLAAPATLAAQNAQDFQLPPNPTPTATPRVQGPVDTESGTIPVRPRAIGTPTPTPAPRSTEMVQPIPTPTPAPVPERSEARPAAQPTVTPQRDPSPLPTSAERPPIAPAGANVLPAPTSTPITSGPTFPGATPSPQVGLPAETEGGQSPGWLFPALGGAGLLALLAGAFFLWRRRRSAAPPPEIERPVVASAAAATGPADLQLRAEAIRLTRSLVNATLQYRVTLINRSAAALSGVAVGADLVSAHGGVPVEQQVASAAQPLEKRHTFDRIAPGQSVRYEGNLQIPLAQAKIIRQGSAALFVPLLRVRIDGAGSEPVVRTFVVGQGVPDGGRVMPFRIDEGPRSYAPVAARALD